MNWLKRLAALFSRQTPQPVAPTVSKAVTWISVKPAYDGWYWHRRPNASEGNIVYVKLNPDGDLIVLGWGMDYDCTPMDKLDGLWAGPIPSPNNDL